MCPAFFFKLTEDWFTLDESDNFLVTVDEGGWLEMPPATMGFLGMVPYLMTFVLLVLGIILSLCLIEPTRVSPVIFTLVF